MGEAATLIALTLTKERRLVYTTAGLKSLP